MHSTATVALIFQSMLPVRGATAQLHATGEVVGISIHAPRAGSDLHPALGFTSFGDFNPCSPCGERRKRQRKTGYFMQFQSMLPVRGATVPHAVNDGDVGFQSMLPVRGATVEGVYSAIVYEFQSMLPVRGAT